MEEKERMDEKKPPPPSYLESVASTSGAASTAFINPGYEDEGISKPPTAPPLECPTAPRTNLPVLPSLTDEQLREACYKYVEDHCCYGSRFIRDMILTDLRKRHVFHYKLESFTEMRESVWTHEGYYGQTVDGPENGPVPSPWDVPVSSCTYFVEKWTTKEIPHTAYVKQCGDCVGNGKVRCDSCSGMGWESCSWCSGSGKDGDDDCTWCSGSGDRRCSRCDGSGMVTCRNCDGHGKCKHYRKLIVKWKNHENNFVSDSWNLPKELVREAGGRDIFNEQDKQVYPLNHAPDDLVNQASAQIVQLHSTSFVNELIIQQRHKLRAIPATKACWIWKDKHGEFYVYGFQNKVYFEDYPMPCCCCTCL